MADPVKPADLQRALLTVDRLRLRPRIPGLDGLIHGLGNNGRLHQELGSRVLTTLSEIEQGLQDTPFLAAPPNSVSGLIPLRPITVRRYGGNLKGSSQPTHVRGLLSPRAKHSMHNIPRRSRTG